MWVKYVIHWNIAGVLASPNDIATHLNLPKIMLKAVFGIALSVNSTYQ